MPAETLLVSVLPRMSRAGESMLVSVDVDSLRPIATRRFAVGEYYRSDRGTVEHCRGLATYEGTLYVAMFNSIRRYSIDDGRDLDLRVGERWSHPGAVDLHGIYVHSGGIVAASTGTDQVLTWSLGDSTTTALRLASTPTHDDMRFPVEIARRAGVADWRSVLPGSLHLNSVCSIDGDNLVVVALTEVFVVSAHRVERLHSDPKALFHDACVVADGRLLLTDAAGGQLMLIDLHGPRVERVPVADPASTFLRGLCVMGDVAIVLGSAVGESCQRSVDGVAEGQSGRGRFEVFVVDLSTWRIQQHGVVPLGDGSAGTVAYSVVPWSWTREPRGGRQGLRGHPVTACLS